MCIVGMVQPKGWAHFSARWLLNGAGPCGSRSNRSDLCKAWTCPYKSVAKRFKMHQISKWKGYVGSLNYSTMALTQKHVPCFKMIDPCWIGSSTTRWFLPWNSVRYQGLATFLWIGALPNPDAASVSSFQLVDIYKLLQTERLREGREEVAMGR